MSDSCELCEFTHFRNANELDPRFTKSVFKEMRLKHPTDSACHPKRSPNSTFTELRFDTGEDLVGAVKLVKVASTKV